MSTLPPIASPNAQPVEPGLSEAARITNSFISPSRTFADLKRNPSWWKPWLLSAVITLAFGIVAGQKIDFARFMQQQIERSPSAQKRMERVSPEQRDQIIGMQATVTKITFYVYPLLILVGGIIFAAILMAVFNFVVGAEVPFGRAMAIVFYSFLPWNLSSILLGISLLVSSDPNSIDLSNPMPTNPAFFMDPQGNKFLYGLAKSVDIFSLWAVILLGLGFAVASSNQKPTTKTGIVTMLVIYGIVTLIGIGYRVAFT